MNIYKVTIFGHRNLYVNSKIEERLYATLVDLIRTREYVEIYIGRNGDFDIYAASVVKRVQKAVGNQNSAMILVLPYTVRDIDCYEKYYDSIVIPECVFKKHPKRAITDRNRWMIEECDQLICCVEGERGGAYSALKYAENLGKSIINLLE